MMRIEGMVRRMISRLAALAALASGLAISDAARADSWQDALRDADDLHEAAEDLYARALRLDDHQAIPATAALDQAAANLYHGLKHHPCAAEVVPLLGQAEAVLNEVSSIMSLSCDMHHDRKAMALLKDARHHFIDTAEHIQCVVGDQHTCPTAPPVRFSQPPAPWSASPYGSQYAPAPAWYSQPSPPAPWGSGYRGASTGYQGQPRNVVPRQPLARVLISEVLTR
jgi:hypothetical protein